MALREARESLVEDGWNCSGIRGGGLVEVEPETWVVCVKPSVDEAINITETDVESY